MIHLLGKLLRKMPRISSFYFLSLMLAATPLGAQIKAKKTTEFGTAVETGFALARYHDTCIAFQMFLLPGKFFEGLRKVDSPDGPEFRRGNQVFHTFPDSLVVGLQATAYRCSDPAGQAQPLDLANGLLSNVSFEASWKAGAQLHPTAIKSRQLRPTRLSSRWNYFLEIPAKDIPLTNDLVIEISARDNISLCRITSAL
jgi:hypothetical protein